MSQRLCLWGMFLGGRPLVAVRNGGCDLASLYRYITREMILLHRQRYPDVYTDVKKWISGRH